MLTGCATTKEVQQFEPVPIPKVGEEELEPAAPPSVEELLQAAQDAFKAANGAQEKGDHEAALRQYNLMLGLLIEADLDPAIFYGVRGDFQNILSATSWQAHLYARMRPPGEQVPFTPGLLGDLGIEFPLPERVLVEIDEIQNLYPNNFQGGLVRGSKYTPYIREELAKAGLPEDLVWLAMVESQFSPKIVSRASAGGMWQFMRSTARRYGLRVDSYVDERFDWRKSTRAAVKHLTELYEMFGSWPLAISAYNMGEGGLERAIAANDGERDLWSLLDTPPAAYHIQTETKKFYAKLLATIIVGKDPGRYGFSVDPQPPDSVADVPVKGSYALAALEKACNLPAGALQRLNPQLIRGVTPKGAYEIAVPAEGRTDVLAALRKLPEVRGAPRGAEALRAPGGAGMHVVRKGETLSEIAGKYHVSAAELARANKIRSPSRVSMGKTLIIPGAETASETESIPAPEEGGEAASRPDDETAASIEVRTRQVKPGDTLYDVAKAEKVSIADLLQWNHLDKNARLRVGQTLHLEPSPAKRLSAAPGRYKQIHVVKTGEFPAKIADRYGVKLEDLLSWNQLSRSSTIKAGAQLVIFTDEPPESEQSSAAPGDSSDSADDAPPETAAEAPPAQTGEPAPAPQAATAAAEEEKSAQPAGTTKVVHKAAKGDNASVIAATYGVRTSDFLTWNNLTLSSLLKAGQEYVVYVAAGKAPQAASGGTLAKAALPSGEAGLTQNAAPQGASPASSARKASARASAAAAPEKPAEKGEAIIHVVAKGQNPTTIARRYGVRVSDLLEWNGWQKAPLLKVGDKVTIRKTGGSQAQ